MQGIDDLNGGHGVEHELTLLSTDFDAFYRKERDGQIRRAFLLLGDSQAANDAVAEAFEALLQRWDQIDHHGPYLSVCVLNACRDSANRQTREIPVERFPEREQEDRADHMADCLMALPFRQRAALVLRYYGGESEAAIAEYLDCKPGTVGSLVHRGLAALRTQLEEQR